MVMILFLLIQEPLRCLATLWRGSSMGIEVAAIGKKGKPEPFICFNSSSFNPFTVVNQIEGYALEWVARSIVTLAIMKYV